MPNSISGKATSKHGDEYTYEVSWTIDGPHLTWDAAVIRDYLLKGTPGGVMRTPREPEIELAIRGVVERMIRELVDIDR
jgi:hypothetical protein